MSSKTQSRASSPKVSSRPKLMRAHATAPSLVTGNASRKDLASLQSSSKAASILSRMASYSAQQDGSAGGSPRSTNSAYSTPGNRSPRSPRSPESGLARSCKEELKGMQLQYQSAGYFSFPSFEDFQGYQEPTERMERKSVS